MRARRPWETLKYLRDQGTMFLVCFAKTCNFAGTHRYGRRAYRLLRWVVLREATFGSPCWECQHESCWRDKRRKHASFATARISFRRRMHLKLFFVYTVRSLVELLLWFESCLSLRRIRQSLSGDTRRWKESRATNVHVWKMSNLNACWYWASICQSWLILISSQLSKACDRKKSKSVKFSREVSLICVSFFNFFSSKNHFFSR